MKAGQRQMEFLKGVRLARRKLIMQRCCLIAWLQIKKTRLRLYRVPALFNRNRQRKGAAAPEV